MLRIKGGEGYKWVLLQHKQIVIEGHDERNMCGRDGWDGKDGAGRGFADRMAWMVGDVLEERKAVAE